MSAMSFLFLCDAGRGAIFAEAFGRYLPDLRFCMGEEDVDVDDVRFIMTWNPPGNIHRYRNLEVVFCIGAGVDQFVGFDFPPQVKLVRMVDDSITRMVVEYVVMAVLSLHRNLHIYLEQQRERIWKEIVPQVQAGGRSVSILGTGVLGRAALCRLQDFGFTLSGWSRSGQPLEGVTSYAGEDGLRAMLVRTDILVCLLPLTADTAGILNRELFQGLRRGACLVQVGRGRQLDADALIEALDSGQLSGAFLDVVDPEPLPADHRLWGHPRIVITPHIAAITQPDSAAMTTIENIKMLRAGLMPAGLVDLASLTRI